MNRWRRFSAQMLTISRRIVLVGTLGTLVLSNYTPERVSAAPTYATPAPFVTRISDLGYTNDLVAQGTLGELSVAFPLPEGGISSGKLTLALHASPVLNPQSTIQISLNDRPATALTVEQLRKQETLTVPISSVNDAFLTVRINGHFFMSNDTCTDERGGALWLVLDRQSNLAATPSAQQLTINDFLQQPGGRVQLHGMWDTPANQAASIALFSSLNAVYRHGTTQVILAEDAKMPMNAAMPADTPTRDVFLAAASDPTPLHMQDNALYVRGDQASLEALRADASTSPLLLGQAVQKLEVVNSATAATNVPAVASTHRLSLADLNINNQNVAGSNDESTTVRFTLADLGGWPSDLHFTLDTSFDPVPTNTVERAFVRVYLNGTLLDTFDIRGQSSLQRTLSLPAAQLKTENVLQTTFSYASSAGACSGSPYRFNGQMHNTSALTWSGYDHARGIFSEIIGLFHGEGQLLLLDQRPEMAQAAARLLGGVSRYSATPLLPHLTDAASLATPPATGYRVVVGGDSTTAQTLKLPLDMNQPLQVINPQTNDVVVRGTPDQPMASVQYIPGTVPVLALQTSSNVNPAVLAATVTQLTSSHDFFQLDGNAIVGNGTQIVALSLVDNTFKVSQPETTSWTETISRYSWLVFVVLAALLVGVWVLVYQRVGRRQQPPQPEV